MRRGVFHAEQDTAHQGRHRRIETRGIEAFDAAGLRRAAGVIEKAIDATELRHGLLDQRTYLVLTGDIGAAEDAVRPKFARQCLTFGHTPTCDGDPRAFADKNLGSAEPNPACRASDDRHFAA